MYVNVRGNDSRWAKGGRVFEIWIWTSSVQKFKSRKGVDTTTKGIGESVRRNRRWKKNQRNFRRAENTMLHVGPLEKKLAEWQLRGVAS